MIELAKATVEQSKVENLTETGESILLQVLLDMVKGDGYVSVKVITDKIFAQFDEQPRWLSTYWVGKTLRRLGFKDKRRVGTGYQYRLNLDDVKDIAGRMGVKPQAEKKGDPQKTLDPDPEKAVMVSVKDWCLAHRDERGEVNLVDLEFFIEETLKIDSSTVVRRALDLGIVQRSNEHGKVVVL